MAVIGSIHAIVLATLSMNPEPEPAEAAPREEEGD